MLTVRDLTLKVTRKCIFPVWHVGLDLGKQERVAVVGESGGGKTSLACGLLGHPLPGQHIVCGRVSFGRTDLLHLSPAERVQFYYRDIALVPQNAQNIFHPTQKLWKSAREVMAKNRPERLMFRDVTERVSVFSESLELPVALWSHYPHQLSGGQKQRMAVILALLNNPRVLLLDEPSNALDELNRRKLVDFLTAWAGSTGAGLLLFTHDMGIAACWATRIVVLYRGEVVEELPARMIGAPRHPYTRGLVAANIRLGDPPLSRCGIPGHAVPVAQMPKGCGFFERCPQAHSHCRHEIPSLVARGESKVRCFAVD